jgi:hypothetical protein
MKRPGAVDSPQVMQNEKDRLITDDETTGLVDGPGAQTSNKAGLASSSRKPSNTGPGPHEKHKAPVDGAFGNPDTKDYDQRDTYIGDQVPADKGRK